MKNKGLLRLITAPAWVLLLALTVIVFLSYSNSLYSPFVLDDIHSFVDDPKVFVDDFSIASLKQLADTKFGLSRFLPVLSFAVDHHIGKGRSIVSYHLTNIVIHLFATTALFFFLYGLLRTDIEKTNLKCISPVHFSFFVCALWALNPVQTNAVTYLVQRMASMATLFYLAALACYVHGRLADRTKKRFFFFSGFILFAICAFLSKQNSATLPFAVLLLELMFISPEAGKRIIIMSKWYHWAGLILFMILISPLWEHRWHALVDSYALRHFTMLERLLTQPRVVIFYISLLALPLPVRMNLEHDFPVSHSLVDPASTLAAIVVLSVLMGMAIIYRRRHVLISFGVLWFFLNLAIESTIFNLELVFEHRLYLPSVGFFIVVMTVIDRLFARLRTERSPAELQQIIFLTMIIILSICSVLTAFRNNDWRDNITIYQDCVNKSPKKARPYLSLGFALGQQQRYEEAIWCCEKAIEFGRDGYEEYLNAVTNIIVSLVERGDYEEAIIRGKEYLEEAPMNIKSGAFIKVMYNLGAAYYFEERYLEAMKSYINGFVYEQYKDKKYFVAKILQTLSSAYDNEESRAKLHLALANGDRQKAVWLRFVNLMLDLRSYDEANVFITKLLTLYPDDSEALLYKKRYQEEISIKDYQGRQSSLQNHELYKTNLSYRLSIAAAVFIMQYYSPLLSTVDWLLDIAQDQVAGNDPFVAIYRLKLYTKRGQRAPVQEIDSALANHPDFVPLLEIAGSYHQKMGHIGKAVEIYEHILKVYPGHPKWFFYKKLIAENQQMDNAEKTQVSGVL